MFRNIFAVTINESTKTSESCTCLQANAVLYCGCTLLPNHFTAPGCTLCPGNANPFFPNATVAGTHNVTYGTYQMLAPNLFTASSCFLSEETTKVVCGCPPAPTCSPCPKNDMIDDPANVVIQTLSGDNLPCYQWDETASFLKAGANLVEFENTCKSFQDDYSPLCCQFAVVTKAPTPCMTITVTLVLGPSASSGARITEGMQCFMRFALMLLFINLLD